MSICLSCYHCIIVIIERIVSNLKLLYNCPVYILQYPQDKTKDVKIPVELRVNIWLGLTAVEKKFNSFAEGTFSVFAEMVCSVTLNALFSYKKHH